MERLLITTTTAIATLLGAAGVSGAVPTSAGRDTIPVALAPFGAEHANLLGGFHGILRRSLAPEATRADREQLVRFLRSAVVPHAQTEERVLYPALDSVLGTRGYATATMVLDHRGIASLTIELASLAAEEPAAFRDRALMVQALVENHFAKEEEFVLPNLARRMSDRDLRALLARMDKQRIAP